MVMSVSDMWDRLGEVHRQNVFSPENMYFAGLAVDHEPNSEEAIVHYFNHTGPHYRVCAFDVQEDARQAA
jgi:hypothetical protein